MMGIRLVSTAKYIPEKLVRNEDFTNFPKSALHLIKEKIGIETRYHCKDEEILSDIACKAAVSAMEKASIPPLDIDCVIIASSTPDRLLPATSVRVAERIGAKNAFAFDMSAACSNGIFSSEVARSLIEANAAEKVLVINGECQSKFLNPMDFSTYPYFGDGAGAMVYAKSRDKSKPLLLPAMLFSDGSGFDAVTVKGGGGEIPFYKMKNRADFYKSMNGKVIYEFATTRVPPMIKEYLKKNSIDISRVKRFILHQANINIISKIASEIGADIRDFQINISQFGNTAGASTAISLAQYLEGNPNLGEGDYVLFCAFGAGLCMGCSAFKF